MPPQVPSPPPAVDKAEGSHGNGAWNPGALGNTWDYGLRWVKTWEKLDMNRWRLNSD
jgi:hypothetical protein